MTYLLQVHHYSVILTEKPSGREETIRGGPRDEAKILFFVYLMQAAGHKIRVLRH